MRRKHWNTGSFPFQPGSTVHHVVVHAWRLSEGIAPWLTNNGGCNEKAWRSRSIFFCALLDADQLSFVFILRDRPFSKCRSRAMSFFFFFPFSFLPLTSFRCLCVFALQEDFFALLNSDQLSFVPVQEVDSFSSVGLRPCFCVVFSFQFYSCLKNVYLFETVHFITHFITLFERLSS